MKKIKIKPIEFKEVKIEEISFSDLSSFDNEGKETPFDAGDEGKFMEDLYSEIDFEILTNYLPAKTKEVFKLRKKEGLSNSEIAKKLGSKKRTIEQLFRRGNEKIREKVRRIRWNQLRKFGKVYE